MTDLQGIWHEEDWPNKPKYILGIDPYKLSDEDKRALITGTAGEFEQGNDRPVNVFYSPDNDILDQRFNRTFKMTESKRRLAEYPKTSQESFFIKDLSQAIAEIYVRELSQFVPKPERTDRLLEYKQIPPYRYHEWNESTFINDQFVEASLGRRYEDPNSPFTDHRMVIIDFSSNPKSTRNDWMNYKDYLIQKS